MRRSSFLVAAAVLAASLVTPAAHAEVLRAETIPFFYRGTYEQFIESG